jgi:cell division protein FtsQ
MSSVAAPADRRFRRAHVKPARRRHDWRRLAVPVLRSAAIALAVAFALYRGSDAVLHARLLDIQRIVVRGNDRLSTGEVLSLLGGLRGQSLLSADLEAWRRALLASPWVRDATMRRSLPSTVDVAIVERQPLAIARMRGALYLIDEGGTVIDEYGPQYADLDLPIVDGLPASGDDDGERAQLVARLLASVRQKPEVARRVSQIDVRQPHNAAVILRGDAAVVHLGDDRFLPRLESYLQVAAALRERVADIDYVDLRFDDRIYVKPASARAAARGRRKP